jgi:serine/threonine-protein kinase
VVAALRKISSRPPPAAEAPTRIEPPATREEPSPPSEPRSRPSPSPSLELVTGTVVAGKYRLERLLKTGGMGAVWVAQHLTLETAVAIKFMSMPPEDEAVSSQGGASSDPGAISRARFEREAKAAAQIRSANVVQILDYGVDRATAYIVMELLEGHDLEQRLRRGQRITLEEAAKIMVPVLQLLQRAHDGGMVHRDLKPANIFLAKDGDATVPKVLDFGVAKSRERAVTTEGDLTADRTLIGTPHYASPEQLKNSAKIDHRADLWSMSVVFFRMLTGKKPFRAAEMIEAIVEVCSAPLPKATSIAPDLPPEVDAFFERGMERDVDKRFQSARQMAQAINDLVEAVADRRVATALEAFDGAVPTPPAPDLSVAGVRPARPAWLIPVVAGSLVALGIGAVVVLRGSDASVQAPQGASAAFAATVPVVSATVAPTATTTAEPAAASAASAVVDPGRRARSPQGGRLGTAPTPTATKKKSSASVEDKEVGY